jgi:hypothetical protein
MKKKYRDLLQTHLIFKPCPDPEVQIGLEALIQVSRSELEKAWVGVCFKNESPEEWALKLPIGPNVYPNVVLALQRLRAHARPYALEFENDESKKRKGRARCEPPRRAQKENALLELGKEEQRLCKLCQLIRSDYETFTDLLEMIACSCLQSAKAQEALPPLVAKALLSEKAEGAFTEWEKSRRSRLEWHCRRQQGSTTCCCNEQAEQEGDAPNNQQD